MFCVYISVCVVVLQRKRYYLDTYLCVRLSELLMNTAVSTNPLDGGVCLCTYFINPARLGREHGITLNQSRANDAHDLWRNKCSVSRHSATALGSAQIDISKCDVVICSEVIKLGRKQMRTLARQ